MLRIPTTSTPAPAPAATPTPTPSPVAGDEIARVVNPIPGLPTIEAGSVAAQALALLWNGEPGIVVKAPPGGGKTAQVICIAALSRWAKLRVAVCCQTNTQAVDLANRLAREATCLPVALMQGGRRARPANLHRDVEHLHQPKDLSDQVVISTTAKWLHVHTRWAPDVLIVDEAWQLTAANLGALAGPATQVCLVGDPGQIAPVVEGDTTRWDAHPAGPHKPAPQALLAAHPDDVTTLTIHTTRRCGPTTAKVLAPLYDFEFTSARPDTRITLPSGVADEFASLAAPAVTTPGSPAILDAAAQRAAHLAEQGILTVAGGTPRQLGGRDVAVGCSHVAEVAGITARLAATHPHITVDTANLLQGLEFAATVIVDPLAGVTSPIDHDLDLGRLCVMLSRHSAHCTWVTTPTVDATLAALPPTATTLAQRNVRHRLATAAQPL